MIKVELLGNSDGSTRGYVVKGHAGRARNRDLSQNITCAGVSTLTDTTALSLHRLLGDRMTIEASSGFMRCELPRGMDPRLEEKVQLLLDSMLLGLTEIAKLHPEHVSITRVFANESEV